MGNPLSYTYPGPKYKYTTFEELKAEHYALQQKCIDLKEKVEELTKDRDEWKQKAEELTSTITQSFIKLSNEKINL